MTSPNQPTEQPWIDWHGGPCPVPEGTIGGVKFRGGASYMGPITKFQWTWHKFSPELDVIAYRPIPPVPTEQPTPEVGTPRTDAEIYELPLHQSDCRTPMVHADFARKLERELAGTVHEARVSAEESLCERQYLKNRLATQSAKLAAKTQEVERVRAERDQWKDLADLKDAKGEANRAENNKLRSDLSTARQTIAELESKVAGLEKELKHEQQQHAYWQSENYKWRTSCDNGSARLAEREAKIAVLREALETAAADLHTASCRIEHAETGAYYMKRSAITKAAAQPTAHDGEAQP